MLVVGGVQITEEERDNIRAFRLRFIANIPRSAYDQMRHSFRHRLHLRSDWAILYRVARLSGVQPVWYDCCPNSCLCYLGDFQDAQVCPDCKEPRYSAAGQVRRHFCYIPFIPRLQALFQSVRLIKQLRYRSELPMESDTIEDVFNSEHYRKLCRSRVVVDGKVLAHCHFSDPRDIAFSFCSDSYLLF
ncbi:hypothetical protein C8Q70DRAFT_909352, partial [Cubamyces menziesii]